MRNLPSILRPFLPCILGLAAALFQPGARASVPEHWPLQGSPGPDGDPKQDPSTYPKSSVPAQAPLKRSHGEQPILAETSPGNWVLSGGWRLKSALKVAATVKEISEPGFDSSGWYPATVPGTVLTTLVDQGIYPDPTYGLNNMAIPESLARQDWWYRTEFVLPEAQAGRTLTLTFNGINYAADVWLNGSRLGEIRGAFRRGVFDLTGLVRPGEPNALAVRISPVPHPGIPHEESLAAGAGPNGGSMCFDGPTFFCTEGWDWIPGIRDRCAGLWQNVVLHVGGPVVLGDVHIKTDLPLPDTSSATVFISVAAENRSAVEQHVTVRAEFEGVQVEQPAVLPPRSTSYVKFFADKFPALRVAHPRLWWPNGYGSPELYHLTLSVADSTGAREDERHQRFGIRHVTYELSAHEDATDHAGRFEINPSATWDKLVVDKRHESIRPGAGAWLPTLAPGALASGGLTPLGDDSTAPFLVIKVNGVPIACKGGNWGLDDVLKRSSRERLEPYFRLQRDAHVTMVRNWCGQNTEEAFFDLADEYGLMVWSDFWLSTQDWNEQPGDLALFLANAEDVIRRFRNHPSIVIWCGRNEGVPPPALNEGLDALVRQNDCSRYYQPSSRDIDLLTSGPWTYGDPVNFFNRYGLGFSTELGLPNPPTADAFRAMMPQADQWPISDTWAYHDWHQKDHGEVQAFMDALALEFGAATSLDDFCRKAQMLNYVGHRAMFEGFNARLWRPASGRLMWMSHPAWPSTEWQLYSSDYDTNAAYFGARKACEPVHVQFNLDDRHVVVANTTRADAERLAVKATLYDLEGHTLGSQGALLRAPANSTFPAFLLDEGPAAGKPLYFLKLALTSADGTLVSDNFYWIARHEADNRLLGGLPAALLTGRARLAPGGVIEVELENRTPTPALLIKPTLRDAQGARILPAYPSDGGFSLMPGESRRFTIEAPRLPAGPVHLTAEGWNLAPVSIAVDQ